MGFSYGQKAPRHAARHEVEPSQTPPDGRFDDGAVEVFHAAHDRLYSVVALLDDQAGLLERVRYSAYGVAKQHSVAQGDVNGDGVTNNTDLNALLSASGKYLSNPGDAYNADADFNADGVVNFSDQNTVLSGWGKAGAPAGQVSQHYNIVGYAGYLFDPATEMSLARFRWYDPEQGRWVNRDYVQYFDGMSMYEYVSSRPVIFTDTYGTVGGAPGHEFPRTTEQRDALEGRNNKFDRLLESLRSTMHKICEAKGNCGGGVQ